MRIIKLAIISFIFFALLITGISLFFPSHIRISKAIDIRTGKEEVMAQVADAANWKNWKKNISDRPLNSRAISIRTSGWMWLRGVAASILL